MARFVSFATAASVILVVSAVTLFVGGTDVDAELLFNATPVRVVNDAISPVVVDDKPGRLPWKQWAVIHLDETDYHSVKVTTVPEGYRLFVTDINVFACVEALKDEMAMNLTIWERGYPGKPDPMVPPATDEVPRTAVMLSHRGIFRGMRHFGGSQQPNIYLDPGETLWAEVYRTSSRLHSEAATWLVGYLEPVGRMEPPPGWEKP